VPAVDRSAARRYADAVFEIAVSEGSEAQWDEDLTLLSEVLGDPVTLAWLMNPAAPAADKDQAVQRALVSVGEGPRNLARMLVSRGRVGLVPTILEAYQERWDDARGIAHALITTAVPVSGEDRAAIEERLRAMTGRQVKMESAVDPSIIGGMIVRMGDKLIDGSTRARLIELKRRLAGEGR
jgi:F-type H+-transporting ATPase subunit delta